MGNDVQETMRSIVHALSEAGQSVNGSSRNGGSGLSGMKGVAAGAGAAVLVPLAVKNAGKLASAVGLDGVKDVVKSPRDALQDLGSNVAGGLGDKLSAKVDEAGGPGGILKDALPFGDDDDDDGEDQKSGNVPGVGKGRRMPVQQSVDIGVPIETVYNQWTQFEEWPTFMHRVTRVTQDDECTVSFAAKIWGKTKEFTANIETMRPDERIKWKVSQGMTHTGCVTFHELGPNLTRVLLTMDVEPGGLLEKAARGMRHVKRAARADLHRFKAFIEMAEHETGAWRGRIEDGEVVEDHDEGYDEDREYSDMDEITGGAQDEDEDSAEDENEDEDEDENEDENEDEEEDERPTRGRQARSGGRSQSRSRGRGGHDDDRQTSRTGQGRRRSGSGQSGRRQSRSRTSHGE